MSSEDFLTNIKGKTKVNLYLIRNENICEYTDMLKKQKLNAVPGTLKLHQVVAAKNSPGVIQYCDISCNCSFNSKCCHDGGRTTFVFCIGGGRRQYS